VRAIAATPCLFDCVGPRVRWGPSFYERGPIPRHKKRSLTEASYSLLFRDNASIQGDERTVGRGGRMGASSPGGTNLPPVGI
jgi:hypothetical protein